MPQSLKHTSVGVSLARLPTVWTTLRTRGDQERVIARRRGKALRWALTEAIHGPAAAAAAAAAVNSEQLCQQRR